MFRLQNCRNASVQVESVAVFKPTTAYGGPEELLLVQFTQLSPKRDPSPVSNVPVQLSRTGTLTFHSFVSIGTLSTPSRRSAALFATSVPVTRRYGSVP